VPAAVLADRLGDLAPLGGNARISSPPEAQNRSRARSSSPSSTTLRGIPHRWKTISRRGAYHGTTMGALSVNGLAGARAPFGPLVPGARHVPMSHRYRCPYCLDAGACTLMCYQEIERAVEFEGPEQIAAIILEPVQNAGGCIPPGSMDYFKKICELCDRTGILMIMDEVICGFGRLGELFGSTYFGVEPDLITTAKGITSSYALLGAYLRSELEAAFANHPHVGDIRGAGRFLGVELVADRATKETLRKGSDLLHWLTDEMRASGLILRNDDRGDPTTQLCPPLVITLEECDRVVAILARCFDELGRRLGSVGTVHAVPGNGATPPA
jgi:adenosylmethionine-8-amino-7-oxononanoate aminotransferase